MSDSEQQITYVDLVRHGRVATPDLFCAHPGEPLSEVGWQQLETTTQNARPDIVLTSPSRRCHDFAEYRSKQMECPLVVIKRFQEMDFGQWVGCSTRSIWERDEDLLTVLWQEPLEFSAPDGESMVGFIGRVQSGWQELFRQHAGKRVLLFTHGGVIRVLLAMALDIPYQKTLGFDLAYGSATRLRVYADGGMSVYGVGVERL